MFVLDASVTMAWCYEDEKNHFADNVFGLIATGQTALVPAIWAIEVANAILSGERRKRLTIFKVVRFIGLLETLPIEPDSHTNSKAFTHTLALAREHGLTVYDATYLELAMRERLTLATLDAKLKAAAEQVGVPVFA